MCWILQLCSLVVSLMGPHRSGAVYLCAVLRPPSSSHEDSILHQVPNRAGTLRVLSYIPGKRPLASSLDIYQSLPQPPFYLSHQVVSELKDPSCHHTFLCSTPPEGCSITTPNMPDRQWYCWRVQITYRCGCIENTSTQHICGPKLKCNSWLLYKNMDKDCDAHRSTGLQEEPATEEGSRIAYG